MAAQVDAARRLRVFVATPLGRNGRGGIDRLNDVILGEVASRGELNISARRLVTRGQMGLIAAQFVFAWALLRLAWAAMRKDVDLVHIHLSTKGSAYRKSTLGALADALGTRYVVHLHAIEFREFWSAAGAVAGRAVDRLFERSARIVVMGRHWSDVITDRLPAVADKIVILANATRTNNAVRISAPAGVTRILFLGKVGARKGTPQLVAALHKLSWRRDWTAVIAGDGEVESTRRSVAKLGLSDRVHVPGWLDVAARDKALGEADILVLPSFAENLPMVIVEAFSRGLAVVSTPVGAIPEVVEDGRNGLLTAAGDVDALANALSRLIDDPDLRSRLGRAAQSDHAAHFSFDAYVERLAELWRAAAPRG